MNAPAATPEPPYCAVIFTSRRADGRGLTVSCRRDEASIRAWKRDTDHQQAQSAG